MNMIFDIGATYTSGYLVDSVSGGVLGREEILTDRNSKKAHENLSNLAARLSKNRSVDYICVGFPAPVENFSRILSTSYFDGPELTAGITFALQNCQPSASVLFTNDVTLNAFHYVNSRRNEFAAIGIGTSVGMKVFQRGRPVAGPNNRGGEIGHLRVAYHGGATLCGCGEVGHLGPECSSRHILKRAIECGILTPNSDLTFHENFQRFCNIFQDGEKVAIQLVRENYRPLALVMASLHLSIGIESFIVFGGTAQALGGGLRSELSRMCQECAWKNGFDWNDGISFGEKSHVSAPSGGHKIIELAKCEA